MVSHGQLDNLQTFDISSKIETHNMLVWNLCNLNPILIV
jgi:hypothetical protein